MITNPNQKKHVLLAMSGGVDSSVAASLLLREGYEVTGVFMRHGEESADVCRVDDTQDSPLLPILQGRLDHKQGCCSASDALDARRVADRLSIPFYALDMQADFKRIVDYFVDEYRSGRTPNPCVQCNNWIKFGRLFEYADAIGADYVATGHYARLLPTDEPNNSIGLFRGIDDGKDQAYVLAGIDRSYLPRMLLPVGGYHKSEIRAMAADVGLRVADKKDSQEICFVSSGKHGEFVRQRTDDAREGDIVTTQGQVVGRHPGIENFTIGQRKGLGVAMHEPYFVTAIETDKNRVVIGRREELGRIRLWARESNWLADFPTDSSTTVSVQIRYNSAPQPASVIRRKDGTFEVEFDKPAEGVAPGQLAVVFRDERVLGGGWIDRTNANP
ncbi:MAG: tRNA 2-thiouridine(34) synthase MnmA [Pirellulaceae bacterium]|nr:tRNA 2-thiouridine(34) synthase MnmA [Pirellulaceae bacterium]